MRKPLWYRWRKEPDGSYFEPTLLSTATLLMRCDDRLVLIIKPSGEQQEFSIKRVGSDCGREELICRPVVTA